MRKKSRYGIASNAWDYVNKTGVKCPVCNRNWKDAPPVYVSEDQGIAMVAGYAFLATDSQLRVLQVLRTSFGRWMSPDHLCVLAYSDTPDVDQPDDAKVVAAAINGLRQRLLGTGYYIETRRGMGYRFMRMAQEVRDVSSKRKSHSQHAAQRSVAGV